MKKTLSLFVIFAWGVASLFAKPNWGKQLSDLLLSYMQLEDVHPDSLESNIDSLKRCRLQSADPARRAVYAAAIARLYGERIHWRSVGNDLRDSMVTWYGRALADKQVLAQTKAKRWKPFVVVGKDEGYFRGDMLNVVWRSMADQVQKSVRDTAQVLPKYADMIAYYRQCGLREGALLLALDSLSDGNREVTEADLIRLRDDYADVPLCAEVYLRLGTMQRPQPRHLANEENDLAVNQAAQRSREWLQEGLTRYPKYKRRAALQNALTRLSDPFMEWNGPTCIYPGRECRWTFTARNVQSVLINGEEHTFPEHDPIATFRDSMVWTAPKPGRYKFTFVPRTRAKLTEKVKPLDTWVEVTTLQPVSQLMPDSTVRVLVVDMQSGRPKPDVEVRAYRPTHEWEDTVLYFVGRTGADGMVSVPAYRDKVDSPRWRNAMTYKITSPDTADYVMGTRFYYNVGRWAGTPKDSTHHINLFTDRGIYRPGQTVHVSGIEYRQLDWEARASDGREHTLVLYDANHKKVEEKTVRADELGVFSADFQLPEGGKNGSCVIECDKRRVAYFRVEEYKRPTFEVVLDDSLYTHGDSCIVRGTARNYDGSPLRSARVTGTYRWRAPWLSYSKRYAMEEPQQLDTLETDDQGRFAYHLLSRNGEVRHSLTVQVDVLSQQGETHNAQRWYWRRGDELPKPEPVKVDSTFLVRCVVDTFAVDRPGRIEVTTNLHDVCLFYNLTAAGRVWKEEMVHLDNETFVLDIPYRKEYDQSLTASFCFVKDGRIYTQDKTIWLYQPDNHLRLHWDTFRDLVQPGQQEEWRLTLRRPDGTPAAANVMVAMYDASLDYFTQHRWRFDIGRGHRTFGVPFQASGRMALGINGFGGWYNQKTRKERPIALTDIDAELFRVRAYTRAMGGRMMYKSASNRMVMMETATPMAAEVATEEMAMATPSMDGAGNMTMHESVVVLTDKVESEDDAAETLAVPMRENFQETAFFMPQLRTDKNGQVAIAFTLPESLTRWNLLGVAHTADMMYTNIEEQIEARKDLMAQLHLPRFLRPGDEAMLTATVRNVSDQRQQGRGLMQILDAKTEKVLKQWRADIALPAQKDTVLHYPFAIANPSSSDGLIVRWAVEGTTCSDGEQRLLPILPAMMHVTNTLAITAYDPMQADIDLSRLFPEGVADRRLTVEYTTHPEQYALQALPPLARARRADVLSLATAYYAGVLANALHVNIADSTDIYLQRIKDLQDANGAFRWYPGMPVSSYLTREVSFLLTRLYMLTGRKHATAVNTRAVHYLLDQRIDSTYLSVADLRTLYIAQYSGVQLSKAERKKVDFLLKLAKREDVEEDGYERQALLAIILKQAGSDRKARRCAKAFRKYLVTAPNRGTYIEFPKGSFTSIDRKLHIHVQLMEALQRLNPEDTLLMGMRRHLLQQKRTQEWSTPVNSANAVFALLGDALNAKGEGPMATDQAPQAPLKDVLTLYRRNSRQQNFVATDDTLGYLRDSLDIEDGRLPLKLRLQKASKGESWGAVYADFQQPFDQVRHRAVGLSVLQEYPREARTGSRYTVRYRISADRDYEYVTLVCPRPAFTEPVDQRSGYRWGGGLGYYRQVHDATTEFNFHQIPRGDYLIEETLYVERDGSYHSGVAVIRCDYADEFQGHSGDAVVKTLSK